MPQSLEYERESLVDFASIVGVVVGGSLIVAAIFLGGAGMGIYVNVPALMITFGGGISATIAQFSLRDLVRLPQLMRKAFKQENESPLKLISDLVRFAEIARRDGILALEGFGDQIDDAFLKRGIQLAVDGTDPELIEQMLSAELEQLEERHDRGKKVLEALAAYFPAYGLIGTLIGLVAMLNNLTDPKVIGPAMAVALLTTLYGSIACYLVFQPMAKKLDSKSKDERLVKGMVIQGVMAIQSGDNPRIVEQKLKTFLPPKLRKPS